RNVTGVQTCALPISLPLRSSLSDSKFITALYFPSSYTMYIIHSSYELNQSVKSSTGSSTCLDSSNLSLALAIKCPLYLAVNPKLVDGNLSLGMLDYMNTSTKYGNSSLTTNSTLLSLPYILIDIHRCKVLIPYN